MSLPWNSQSDGSIHVAACAGLLSASAFYQLVLVGLCCPQPKDLTILYNNVRMHSLIEVYQSINQERHEFQLLHPLLNAIVERSRSTPASTTELFKLRVYA